MDIKIRHSGLVIVLDEVVTSGIAIRSYKIKKLEEPTWRKKGKGKRKRRHRGFFDK